MNTDNAKFEKSDDIESIILAFVKDKAGVVGSVMRWNTRAEIDRWIANIVSTANDYNLAVLKENTIVGKEVRVNKTTGDFQFYAPTFEIAISDVVKEFQDKKEVTKK